MARSQNSLGDCGGEQTRKRVRPVAVWDVPSRVLPSAREHPRPSACALDRGAEQWADFKRSPLETECRYVVATDITSCYQYIDHALLAEELHVRGCDPRSVDALPATDRSDSTYVVRPVGADQYDFRVALSVCPHARAGLQQAVVGDRVRQSHDLRSEPVLDEYAAGLARLRKAAQTETGPVTDALDLLILT